MCAHTSNGGPSETRGGTLRGENLVNEARNRSGTGKTRGGRAGAAGLFLPPVVTRELVVAMRRGGVLKSRFKVAWIGVLCVSLFLLFGMLVPGFRGWEKVMHFYLVLAGLNMAVLSALANSAGLFASERRQQTLELLYLTGMEWWELFTGKLVGGALVTSSNLLALAPLLAVPFLSGGLSFDLFLATVVCLPTVFVLVLMVGALASAMCKDEGTASVVAMVLLGIVCLALPLPYNMGFWVAGSAPFDKSWLCLSPALGPWLVCKDFSGFRVHDFWVWAGVTWGWSVIFLAVAGVALKSAWQREVERTGAEGWRAKWEEFVRGSARWRARLYRRTLGRQPCVGAHAYQWLVERDRLPVLQAYGFIAAVCGLWLLGWCAWPRFWLRTGNLYTTAFVLLMGLNWLVSRAAARRMASDRCDGAIELLLTTELQPEEMLEGQEAAVGRQFRPLQLVLCVLLLGMVGAGFLTRTWTAPGIVSYLLIWCLFFAWCWTPAKRVAPLSMWVAANCGRPISTIFRTKGGVLANLGMYYCISMTLNMYGSMGQSVGSFPTGSVPELVVVVVAVSILLLIAVGNRQYPGAVRESLINQLRLIAQEPVPERHDPRFKKWKDIGTRFPAREGERFGQKRPPQGIYEVLSADLGRVMGLAWGKLWRMIKIRLRLK